MVGNEDRQDSGASVRKDLSARWEVHILQKSTKYSRHPHSYTPHCLITLGHNSWEMEETQTS